MSLLTARFQTVAGLRAAATHASMGEQDEDGYAVDGGYADCPACGGVGNLMGQLGSRAWYRCRDCGTTFDGGGKMATRKQAAGGSEEMYYVFSAAAGDSPVSPGFATASEAQAYMASSGCDPDDCYVGTGFGEFQSYSDSLADALATRKTAALTCPTCGEPVEMTPSSGMYRHVNSLTGPCGIRLMDTAQREDGSYTDDYDEEMMNSFSASKKTSAVNWTEEVVPMQLYPGLTESVVLWSGEMMGVIAQIASVRGGFNWYVYSSEDDSAPELDSGVEVNLAAAQRSAEKSMKANTTQMSLFSTRKIR